MKLATECARMHDMCWTACDPCPYCEPMWPPRDEETGRFVKWKEEEDD